MIPPTAYIAAGTLLAGALAGWTVRDWKADSDALEAENKAHSQFVAMSQALADQSLAYEVLAQSIRASERTDRQTIREYYRDKVVPSQCAADPAVVQLLSEAVTDANAAASGQSGGDMPAPSAAAKPPHRP
jgi:hypothetical protein